MGTSEMTEWEILELASLIKERKEWESKCGGCKHLKRCTWYFAGREGITYSCGHPERQSGENDPHPYGCRGYRYEK